MPPGCSACSPAPRRSGSRPCAPRSRRRWRARRRWPRRCPSCAGSRPKWRCSRPRRSCRRVARDAGDVGSRRPPTRHCARRCASCSGPPPRAATGTRTDPAAPERQSGYIVLGMGKYGAYELNYSSDIDLIVFFDADARACAWRGSSCRASSCGSRAIWCGSCRSAPATATCSAPTCGCGPTRAPRRSRSPPTRRCTYYESVGQNWERAALIKARPVAGDIEAGRSSCSQLAPFIWRKYLDFAAIADIHAMKRQIHAFRGHGKIAVAGHDIKLGRGGIREIEFFAQTQQLIAGGRQPDLRVPQTLAALAWLAERGWIKAAVAGELEQAYLFLRRIEHRLQMVADEQTHELPEDAGGSRELRAVLRLRGSRKLLARSRRAPRDGAAALRCAVRGYAGTDRGRREHGLRRRGGRPCDHRGARGDGVLAAVPGHRHGARLASRPLPRGPLSARARAPDRGATAARRGARRHRRSGSGIRQLRPVPRRTAGGRATLRAAAREPRPSAPRCGYNGHRSAAGAYSLATAAAARCGARPAHARHALGRPARRAHRRRASLLATSRRCSITPGSWGASRSF